MVNGIFKTRSMVQCYDKVAYKEILKCTNKDLVLDSDRYWDGVECEVFNLMVN